MISDEMNNLVEEVHDGIERSRERLKIAIEKLEARLNVAQQALTEIHDTAEGSAGMMRIEALARMALFEVKKQ